MSKSSHPLRRLISSRTLGTRKTPKKFFFLRDLPNELILLICQHLTKEKDINNFSRCSQRLHGLLTPDLYRHNIRHFAGSALIWAANKGQAGTVEKLLKYGADPNLCVEPVTLRTPLAVSVSAGDFTISKLLLDSRKCILSNRDRVGSTPLSLAASENNEKLVDLLLRHGAGAQTGQSLGCPLRIAWAYGHTGIVRLLLTEAILDVNATSDLCEPPLLIQVIMSGCPDIFSLMLSRKDLDMNITDLSGRTALMTAAQDGYVHAVKALLARGALPDATDNRSETALFKAAERGYDEVISTLLKDTRVKIDSHSSAGWTPLMAAVTHGHASTVRLLVARGANPNGQAHLAHTPLALAASCGRPSVLRILLGTAGIEPDIRCCSGQTPLAFAIADKHRPLLWWCPHPGDKQKSEAVEMLLSTAGVNPDSKDHDGRTPLWHAADCRNAPIVQLFLAQPSVDPDSKDNSGCTPLLQAASQLKLESVANQQIYLIILSLLEIGRVNVNARDRLGRSALSYAAQANCTDIVKMLMDHKADPTIADHGGRLPREYARREVRHRDSQHKPQCRATVAALKRAAGPVPGAVLFHCKG